MQWTFLFETAAKRAVRYVKTVSLQSAPKYIYAMKPGSIFLNS